MILGTDLNLNSYTSTGKSEGIGRVTNPSTNSFAKALSTEGSIFSLSKDKREYEIQQENSVAYANPFSFQSLFGGSNNGSSNTVSAFDA